ncbi:MAG: hypothetical protein J6U82_06715 [Alistipes sp.]|nr:hypothetical protein [Alistipes sp.]
MKRGMNPNAVLSQIARSNPQVNQMMKILNGKSEAELRQFAQNLAKERGVDLDNLMRSMGITIPSNR